MSFSGKSVIPLLQQLNGNGCVLCQNAKRKIPQILKTCNSITGSSVTLRCFINSVHSRTLGPIFSFEQKRNLHTTWDLSSRTSDIRGQRALPKVEIDSDVDDDLKIVPLPQINVPCQDGDTFQVGESSPFKGMNTDFPCVTRNKMNGPEPEYHKILSGFKTFTSPSPFKVKYNGSVLPEVTVAYETWGKLNEDRSNAVLIHAGLSASSHAKSHKDNMKPGWWEKFVGPGCAVDTDKFFVICTNNLGSCYGTTGPSATNPLTEQPYATTFPVISVDDMVNAQFLLLDYLGIEKLHGSVGSSLGGMCSLMSAALQPERVGRIVSISSCAQSHPSSIAMRYLQRKTIMCDPNWNKGHYYDGAYPKVGMKLARSMGESKSNIGVLSGKGNLNPCGKNPKVLSSWKPSDWTNRFLPLGLRFPCPLITPMEIATLTYRSGPEWDERFGRGLVDENLPPSLCPNFLIESYLEHQGESFSTKYDPNSLLYISKAMDLFDMSEGYSSLTEGLARVQCPSMVVGVQTDILFPIWQQRELAKVLQDTGNPHVTFYELNSIFGHDTFLLDLNGVGAAVKGFLETDIRFSGMNLRQKQKNNIQQKDRKHF